jgi:hypothetical protein
LDVAKATYAAECSRLSSQADAAEQAARSRTMDALREILGRLGVDAAGEPMQWIFWRCHWCAALRSGRLTLLMAKGSNRLSAEVRCPCGARAEHQEGVQTLECIGALVSRATCTLACKDSAHEPEEA